MKTRRARARTQLPSTTTTTTINTDASTRPSLHKRYYNSVTTLSFSTRKSTKTLSTDNTTHTNTHTLHKQYDTSGDHFAYGIARILLKCYRIGENVCQLLRRSRLWCRFFGGDFLHVTYTVFPRRNDPVVRNRRTATPFWAGSYLVRVSSQPSVVVADSTDCVVVQTPPSPKKV